MVDVREQQFLSLKALSTYSKCLRCPSELVCSCQKKKGKKLSAYTARIPDLTAQPCPLIGKKKKKMAVKEIYINAKNKKPPSSKLKTNFQV